MFHHRLRPPTPPLDARVAEHLLAGGAIDDLPEAYRPLGELVAALSAPATRDELEGSAAAAAAFVAAYHAAERTPPRRTRSLVASIATALAVVASTGTAFAASQGALPEPVQQVAHEALGVVGINVPGIAASRDGAHEEGTSSNTRSSATSTTDGSNGAARSRGGVTVTTTAPTGPASDSRSGPSITPPGQDGTPSSIDGDHSGGNGGNVGQGQLGGDEGDHGSQGNQGQGDQVDQPDPGQGQQGEGNSGNAGGPPASVPGNGRGNGPAIVPPGQARK